MNIVNMNFKTEDYLQAMNRMLERMELIQAEQVWLTHCMTYYFFFCDFRLQRFSPT